MHLKKWARTYFFFVAAIMTLEGSRWSTSNSCTSSCRDLNIVRCTLMKEYPKHGQLAFVPHGAIMRNMSKAILENDVQQWFPNLFFALPTSFRWRDLIAPLFHDHCQHEYIYIPFDLQVPCGNVPPPLLRRAFEMKWLHSPFSAVDHVGFESPPYDEANFYRPPSWVKSPTGGKLPTSRITDTVHDNFTKKYSSECHKKSYAFHATSLSKHMVGIRTNPIQNIAQLYTYLSCNRPRLNMKYW